MNTTITLPRGYKIGDTYLNIVTLRETTALDVIEAHEESEKLVCAPVKQTDGSVELQNEFVTSPTKTSANVLRRQIVKLEAVGQKSVSGPIEFEDFDNFSPEDLNALQAEANKFESAGIAAIVGKEAETGGRPDQSGEDD